MDVALVNWFSPPQYPDGDPLWVQIDNSGQVPPAKQPNFLHLDEMDPARILYELDTSSKLNMMRIEGVDVML